MMYTLYKTLLKIKKNILLYCVLISQMTVTLAFIVFALNYNLANNDALKEQGKYFTDKTSSLTIYASPTAYTGEPMFTYSDYEYIREKYSEVLMPLFHYEEKLTDDVSILFLSDTYFMDYTEIKDELSRTVYIGKNVKINESAFANFMIGNDTFVYQNKEYGIKKLENVELIRYLIKHKAFHSGIDADNFVVMAAPFAATSLLLEYKENNPKVILAANAEIAGYLFETHNKQYNYMFENVLERVAEHMESVSTRVELFGYTAYLALAALVFGFTGIVMINTSKRKHELAISMCLGAGIRMVLAEFFIELVFISFTGVALGLLGGYYLTEHYWILPRVMTNPYAIIKFYNISIYIGLLIGLTVTLLASLYTAYQLKRMSPAEVMRKL